jgi:acetyl esterase
MGFRSSPISLIVLVSAALLLAGCGAPPLAPSRPDGPTGVTVVDDVDFGAPGNVRLDVCLPEDGASAGLPAVVSVHGGGWSQGDKAERPWREVCTWLASEGFVVFQPNYRLAPDHPFPAAIDDVTAAVEWIRDDEQVRRFGHDPARLGAFGDSAGGNLVSLLGTRGDGDTASGTRVAAVVELSAPIDLTRDGTALGGLSVGFQRVQLDYLGCASYTDCAAARVASPLYQVDASDPPFFVAHSEEEFIPVEQAEEFVAELEGAGVDVTYVPVAGGAHALNLLDDDLRTTIAGWLRDRLSG